MAGAEWNDLRSNCFNDFIISFVLGSKLLIHLLCTRLQAAPLFNLVWMFYCVLPWVFDPREISPSLVWCENYTLEGILFGQIHKTMFHLQNNLSPSLLVQRSYKSTDLRISQKQSLYYTDNPNVHEIRALNVLVLQKKHLDMNHLFLFYLDYHSHRVIAYIQAMV